MKRNKRRLFKGGELYLNLGNIGYTRRRQTEKNTTQKTKKMSNTDPPSKKKTGGELRCSQRLTFPASYKTLVMLLSQYVLDTTQTNIHKPSYKCNSQPDHDDDLKNYKICFCCKKKYNSIPISQIVARDILTILSLSLLPSLPIATKGYTNDGDSF